MPSLFLELVSRLGSIVLCLVRHYIVGLFLFVLSFSGLPYIGSDRGQVSCFVLRAFVFLSVLLSGHCCRCNGYDSQFRKSLRSRFMSHLLCICFFNAFCPSSIVSLERQRQCVLGSRSPYPSKRRLRFFPNDEPRDEHCYHYCY